MSGQPKPSGPGSARKMPPKKEKKCVPFQLPSPSIYNRFLVFHIATSLYPPAYRRRTESDFAIKLQFYNKLPDLPFEPKFLKVPLDESRCAPSPIRLILSSHYSLKLDSPLERNLKKQLLSDLNLGVNFDFIDLARYQTPDQPPPLSDKDARLLNASLRKEKETMMVAALVPSGLSVYNIDQPTTRTTQAVIPEIGRSLADTANGDPADWPAYFKRHRATEVERIKESFHVRSAVALLFIFNRSHNSRLLFILVNRMLALLRFAHCFRMKIYLAMPILKLNPKMIHCHVKQRIRQVLRFWILPRSTHVNERPHCYMPSALTER